MELADFKFDKYSYSFSRKHGKNTQEIGFLFINQFPINYRVNFLLQIRNQQIREIKSAFLRTNIYGNDFKLSSLMLLMSDFIEENSTQQPSKDYKLFTNTDLFAAAASINIMLQEKVIPLCDKTATVSDIDNFFANRPGWSVEKMVLENIINELIAARINRKRNFDELYESIMRDINLSIENGKLQSDTRTIIESCYRYLKAKV